MEACPKGSPVPMVSSSGPTLFLAFVGMFFIIFKIQERQIAVWIPNLQPDFNVRVIDGFDARLSAVLRELDESNRFVQKSAESTSI